MPYYGQITGTDNDVAGSWFIELNDDGTPRLGLAATPTETMPDVVPVWTIELPIAGSEGSAFTQDEACDLALLMMRRRMAELKGLDAGS
jgi:hypothetical protein